ncbi:hypothetical protein BH11MYX1_BH11MYX1_21980 [soil metagenome]
MQRNSNFEKRNYRELYAPKGNKFVIGTITGTPLEIVAQYNPKELSRTAAAAWNNHPNTSAKQSKTGDSLAWMEYGTSEPRAVTLELLFDGYEEGISIADLVEHLESLTVPHDRNSRVMEDRHPQLCVAVWGTQTLRCVVISVTTKLTMFDTSGEPLRATCSVTLKEVDVVSMMHLDGNAKGYDTRVSELHKRSGGEAHERRRHWNDDRQIVDANTRANLRGTNAPPSSQEPAWTPPPAKPAKPVERTAIAGVEDEDDQDLADDQEIQAQNEQDAKDDAATDAADRPAEMPTPKPTETVAGASSMPGGTYEVGAPSEPVDPDTLERRSTNAPDAPASHPVDPDVLGELE